jgi:O-antigen/teichoic acid export membrane protein
MPSSKFSGNILKNAAFLFLGQIITGLLSLLVAVYVPRYVGPTGLGEMSLASSLLAITSTLLALGMGVLITRDIARDPEKAPELVGAALATRMVLALPSLGLVALVAWLVHYPPHTQVVIAIASIGMVAGSLMLPFDSGFQAFEKMKFNSFTAIISEAVIALASVIVVLLGHGVIMLTTIGTIAALVVLFLNVYWWRKLSRVHLHINFRLMRYLLVSGLPFWATGLFLTIYLYVDSVMLSVMTNRAVVGWYAMPTKLFGLLLFIPTILGTAMFPALARAYKQAPREMVKLARRSFNLITCLSLPMAVGGILLSKQIILPLYGLAFGPSIPVMTVLSAMVVPTYLNILVNQFLVATGRQVAWTKVMAGACVVNPLLNLGLITYYQQVHGNGAFGAAWALLLTEGAMAVLGIVLLPRGILGWSNVVSVLKSTAAAGLMALAIWYTQNYFIAIPILVGGTIYVVVALLVGALPREEFEMLQIVGDKMLRKAGIKRTLPQADMKTAA